MSEPEVLKPLKTWSHLASRRRKPSEYEIVSTNLLYNTRPGASPFELDPDVFMNTWYRRNRDESGLQHPDWNSFRDPDELVYRTYTMLQDGQETYVYGLFDQFNEREHDTSLDASWVATLAQLYTPGRYLFHTLQMASAYLQQMSPASTITNCAAFQAADSMRWMSHTAYRTKELSLTHTTSGFGTGERDHWENACGMAGIPVADGARVGDVGLDRSVCCPQPCGQAGDRGGRASDVSATPPVIRATRCSA